MPRLTLEALGTRWWIHSPDSLPESQITAMIQTFENNYSRFDPNSNLGTLNNTKRFVQPSSEFVGLIQYGLDLYAKSQGLFNISVGAELERAGYGQPSNGVTHISSDLLKDIQIRLDRIQIAPHIRLDFGGFGKGWLIDRVGELLRAHNITSYLINAGGDILVGEIAEDILIEHPLNPSKQIGSASLKNCALASSSTHKRRWTTKEGEIKTHILTPTPHESPLSSHVLAKSALEADSMATILLLMNSSERQAFMQSDPIEYLLIDSDLQFNHTQNFRFKPNISA